MMLRGNLLNNIKGHTIRFIDSDGEYTYRDLCKKDILDVLNAPTEEQETCRYCHEPFKPFLSETDATYGVIDYKVFGVYAGTEELVKLMMPHCPQCGRKVEGN